MADEQLFLAPINDRFREAVRDDENAKPWLVFADELARVGLALLHDIEVPTYDGRKFAAAGIFARAHQSLQAAVIVIERGMVGDGRAILRTVVEAAIALNALANDENFGQRLASASHADSLKLTNMLLNKPDIRAEVSAEDIALLEATRDQLMAMPKEERSSIIWDQVAQKHCPDLYDTLYRLLSMDGTHINAGSLARRFERNGEDFTMMKVGPDVEGLVSALQAACAAFLHSIEPFVKLYPVSGYAEKVDVLVQRLKAMEAVEIAW
ncbi:MAG: hypothetical protein HXY28_04010 [Hydrogenophilaceae bacterium]|jgi:hypothetical protein|nr:hypothetical protein [Hydrogenophilaceae bacterium]